jgi:hypothetical protein
VHVLLDSKGKTLSHAYVEVKDAATAGAILRGEATSPLGKKERGSVLGRGRRARGVTITRSGQAELMKEVRVYLSIRASTYLPVFSFSPIGVVISMVRIRHSLALTMTEPSVLLTLDF